MVKALWDWYTEQIKQYKTPLDALKYSIEMALNWKSAPHLYETIHNVCFNEEHIRDMGIDFGDSKTCDDAVDYVWCLKANRAWSLAKCTHLHTLFFPK